MRYFKPWTTLALGVVIGYVVVPKVMQRVG
jgi:hypothetical protein